MDFYAETYQQKEVAVWNMIGGAAIFTIGTATAYLAPRDYGTLFGIFVILGQMVCAGIAYGMFFAGWRKLQEAYILFCENRMLAVARRVHASHPEIPIFVVTRKAFRRESDLRALEKFICDRLIEKQRWAERIRAERRRAHADAMRCDELQEELFRVVDAHPWLPLEKRRGVLEDGADLLNPKRKKRFVENVARYLDWDRFMQERGAINGAPAANAAPIAPKAEPPTDPRLPALEAEAAACTSEGAQAFYRAAGEQTDRRAKIRLLKQAIRTERNAISKAEDAPPAPKPDAADKLISSDVKFVALSELLEERFEIAHLFPKGVDAVMAKEILIVLLEPGRRKRRFQESYRPEPRIKRRVVNRYNAWVDAPFDPSVYRKTLDWLLREGVLRIKPEKSQPGYSLSANMRETRSETARALIAAILKFDDEFHNRHAGGTA